MVSYSITEDAKEEADTLITDIRHLIKERRLREARHKLVKLGDIFLNAKTIGRGDNDGTG